MKGTNLGELEEITLLVVANLYDNAYAVLVRNEIEVSCDRKITISTVHNVLQRLQEKGYLSSRYSEPTNERGGKRKLLFKVTASGHATLQTVKEMRKRLWEGIPKIAFE